MGHPSGVTDSMTAGASRPTLLVRGRRLQIDAPLVMGVVNASPESFSDGGRYSTLDARLELCSSLVAAGAEIVDVGGQSAVTNQPELDASEELRRVLPIVEFMREQHPDVLLSVDTYKVPVVDAVLGAGASMINDVSGLMNIEVAASCARHGAALVVMHTRASPKVRLQRADLYDDVATDVRRFLESRIARAIEAGLDRESVIVDPGPDFTKTPHQTLHLLRGIDRLRGLDRPILLALSRKDFLGAITQRPPAGRDAATAAAVGHFAAHPGHIFRVHDVAAAHDVIRTVRALQGHRDIDPEYVLPDSLRYEPRA
jgi:dihydropteroate synthase